MVAATIGLFAFMHKDIKVPPAAKQAFAKAHPGATGKWEKEGVNYEVNFKENGKTMSCVIEPKGVILETETDIAISELPASASAYVKDHYKGAVIKDASAIVKNTGEMIYEAGVAHNDILFDKTGKFIKVVKD